MYPEQYAGLRQCEFRGCHKDRQGDSKYCSKHKKAVSPSTCRLTDKAQEDAMQEALKIVSKETELFAENWDEMPEREREDMYDHVALLSHMLDNVKRHLETERHMRVCESDLESDVQGCPPREEG